MEVLPQPSIGLKDMLKVISDCLMPRAMARLLALGLSVCEDDSTLDYTQIVVA